MQKLKKDIAQYRDLNSKHEKILRDIEKNKNNPQKSLQKFSRKIFSSNPQPSYIESSYNTKTQVPSESAQKILYTRLEREQIRKKRKLLLDELKLCTGEEFEYIDKVL